MVFYKQATILHLSDLHVGASDVLLDDAKCERLFGQIACELRTNRLYPIDFVIVSGDVVWKGSEASQYSSAAAIPAGRVSADWC